MHSRYRRYYFLPLLILLMMLRVAPAVTDNTGHLSVTTSANKQSNAAGSFVVVPHGEFIPQGIMRNSKPGLLTLQIPFVIQLKQQPPENSQLQWRIEIHKDKYGSIEVLSKFRAKRLTRDGKSLWESERLDDTVYDRDKLVFKPRLKRHSPAVYKKGRGNQGKRRRYGGGSQLIDDQGFNPRHSYQVTLEITRGDKLISRHTALIRMDNKDLIRQEYINHYGIKRYGRGDEGKLPVPYREEISELVAKPATLMGNPLTESRYGLMINDGMSRLASLVVQAYEQQLQFHNNQQPLKDLNNRPLEIPGNKLWLSGGWRNPERNEWYSNALNGMHQRGGAVDIIVYEPPGHINAAITYWVLWNGLQQMEGKIDGFWQLETNGRPMRTAEFSEDVEPVNGIPDAFDKADHLHINIVYEE